MHVLIVKDDNARAHVTDDTSNEYEGVAYCHGYNDVEGISTFVIHACEIRSQLT